MKKLITAAVASAFAFLAMGVVNGDQIQLPSGTSVEDYTGALKTAYDDDGETTSNRKWLLVGDDNAELLVTNYESSVELPARPEQFDGQTNNNFLKIDTNGRLYRSIGVNSQTVDSFPTTNICDGIYLDTLVQFTAADDEFKADAITAGDKIAIEYVEREEERDGNNEITVTALTNFVVRAGYVVGSSIVATNYYLTFPGQAANAVQFDKTAWHRLTVRAISNVTKDENANAPVGFIVYIDGTNLVYDASVAAGDAAYVDSLNSVVQTYLYNSETHALLPSLLRYGETDYDKLSAVAFNGNGCVDDISFTATKPGILPAEGMTVTIAWDANVASYTVAAGETKIVDGEVVSGEGSTNLLLSAGITAITVTATYADGYEAGAWSASAGTLNNGVWTFENGATLTINSMFPTFDVGGVHYGSFAAALIAAVEAGTAQNPAIIKLLADTSETIAFSEGNIVLDLNGKTLYPGATARYVVANQGASLKIIDTATGGIVKKGSSGSVLIRGDAAFTTIDAGKYEGTIAITGLDEAEPEQVLVVNGGKFYDEDYEEAYEDDPSEAKFYLIPYVDAATHTITGPDENFYFTVSSNVEPPAPEIPTYELTIPSVTGASAEVTSNDVVVADLTAIPSNTEVVVTWTLASGYKLTAGSLTENITMDSKKTAAAPTVAEIDYATLTIETVANCTIVVSNATEEVATNTKFDKDEAVELTVYRTPAEGYELDGCAATETITMDADRTVTAAVKQSGGKTYPSYISGDTEKGKYDSWAEYAGISAEDFPDASGANEDAYLLNCKPSEVAAAKAAFKFTSISYDTTESKWVTTTTTSYNERAYNGTVVVTRYSDVGCKSASETGTFFKATLQ